PSSRWRVATERLVTFHLVCLGWLFFRADSMGSAFVMLERLCTAWGRAPLVTPLLVLTIAAVVGAQYVPPDAVERIRVGFARRAAVAQAALLGAALLVVTTLGPQGVAPFIYYRF
ncbi:MAG TPA: hypothetical protein VE991_14220, partial [Acidimicrobiales bacterium]|nr:hypothetical protein [Acidimicrobiales bacterium]